MRTAFIRAAAVGIGLFASLILLEGALRLAGWPSPGLYSRGHGPLELRPPGHVGGAYPPNVVGRLRHYDYDVEWVVNGDGFRERSLVPKRPGEWRIGILGDSFAVGLGVERHLRFGDIWFEKVRQPHMVLWNLATPLCGTACEAAILEGVGRKHELDEIILVFYGGNDVTDNAEWYEFAEVERSGSEDGGSWNTIRRLIREHSRAATFAWVQGLRSFAIFTPPGIYSASSLQSSWPLTERALESFKKGVGGRPLRIWYIPAIPEWDDQVWSAIRQKYLLAEGGRLLVRSAMQQWAERNGIEFIDTSVWLRDCSSVTACTFPIDGHWNAEGHRRVGEGLASVSKRVERVGDVADRRS
jgi:hypothetical protein